MGDLIVFDFLDMCKASDMGVGLDNELREILVVRDLVSRAIAAISTQSRHTGLSLSTH